MHCWIHHSTPTAFASSSVLHLRSSVANGSGISEERIAEIKDKIDKALNERQVGNIGGLGIVNTIVRLTMTHNKNLKYDIYNDNGMEIKIVVGE